MPVINIKSLHFENEVNIPELLKKLNTETARAIGYEQHHIWSYWEFIEPNHYAVAGNLSAITTENTHSPIVNVISFEGKSKEHIERMLKTIAEVLSEELKIDIGNIFITYTEASSGKVFDGGNIIF